MPMKRMMLEKKHENAIIKCILVIGALIVVSSITAQYVTYMRNNKITLRSHMLPVANWGFGTKKSMESHCSGPNFDVTTTKYLFLSTEFRGELYSPYGPLERCGGGLF
jgi:hypothetical protein